MSKPRAVVSWSGGKDCCLALHRARREFDIVGLISMFTEDGSRSRSHGLRPEVLRRQADALALPLLTANAAWDDYETRFVELLARARAQDVSHVIFGDVYPDAHKQWAESVCGRAGVCAIEPLWAESTAALLSEFLRSEGKAVLVTVRDGQLGEDWLGKTLTPEALEQFQRMGIDPCGENGEYHTFVTWFPGFRFELPVRACAVLAHGGCSLLDLVVDEGPVPGR